VPGREAKSRGLAECLIMLDKLPTLREQRK
jgi:hypothetical protein